MADYYLPRMNTQNLIKLIESTTRHQAGLRLNVAQDRNITQLQEFQMLRVAQERNITQLQELQAELFRRIA